MRENKVFVIALDGATFNILNPLMDQDKLPTIRRLIEQGVHGKLRSVIPPSSPSAWPSFITGKNPGKHRVFSFFVRDDKTGQDSMVCSGLRKGRAFWDFIGESGGKVIVLNVPTTYPPQKVQGVLISGFLTPPNKKDFTYPKSLAQEIEERFGEYPLYLKTPQYSAGLSEVNLNRFLKELHRILDYKCKVAHYLLDRFDFELFILHLWETDQLQHDLWNLLDSTHPQYDKNLSMRCREKIDGYYTSIDSEINNLLERIEKETSVFIISDHGFGPIHSLINLNAWFLREGYIQLKKNAFSRLRFTIWKLGFTPELLFRIVFKKLLKLRRTATDKSPYDSYKYVLEKRSRIFLSLRDIDFDNTTAYSKPGNIGAIYINKKCYKIMSSVDPEREIQKIAQNIAESLENLRDSRTNSKIKSKIYFKKNIYKGRYLNEAPDLFFYSQISNYLSGSILGFGSNKVFLDNLIYTGHHRINGIFIAQGKNINSGTEIKDAELIDLAPTILFMMKDGIPKDMDGKILKTIFTPSFLSQNKPQYIDDTQDDDQKPLTPQEQEDIEKRLKDLRYIT